MSTNIPYTPFLLSLSEKTRNVYCKVNIPAFPVDGSGGLNMRSFKERVAVAFFPRLVVCILIANVSHGFVTSNGLETMSVPSMSTTSCSSSSMSTRRSHLICQFALTERQMQFWEDVDEGLNDIEAFFVSSKGMDIDRVRRFAKRYDIGRGTCCYIVSDLIFKTV